MIIMVKQKMYIESINCGSCQRQFHYGCIGFKRKLMQSKKVTLYKINKFSMLSIVLNVINVNVLYLIYAQCYFNI